MSRYIKSRFLRKTPHPAHGFPCGVFQKCRRNDREKSRLNSRVVDSKDDLHGPRGSLPAARAGVVPRLARSKRPMYSFARRDVRHVYQHRLGAMQVEYLAAGTC